jgi:hypothetical protein
MPAGAAVLCSPPGMEDGGVQLLDGLVPAPVEVDTCSRQQTRTSRSNVNSNPWRALMCRPGHPSTASLLRGNRAAAALRTCQAAAVVACHHAVWVEHGHHLGKQRRSRTASGASDTRKLTAPWQMAAKHSAQSTCVGSSSTYKLWCGSAIQSFWLSKWWCIVMHNSQCI